MLASSNRKVKKRERDRDVNPSEVDRQWFLSIERFVQESRDKL